MDMDRMSIYKEKFERVNTFKLRNTSMSTVNEMFQEFQTVTGPRRGQ